VGGDGIDPKLAYWTWALVNFALVVVCALVGVRRIRSRQVHGHRKWMLAAAAFVGLFLVSYLVKVALLGREERGTWSTGWRWALYVHEACVATMLVAAGVALTRARRFGALREGDPPAPEAREQDLRTHRRVGRVAVTASVLALATAAVVLAGMYTRAGC
jgi:uncharacterized membrane protein YozB (DUF420 family)